MFGNSEKIYLKHNFNNPFGRKCNICGILYYDWFISGKDRASCLTKEEILIKDIIE